MNETDSDRPAPEALPARRGPDSRDAPATVIFLHIGKTAGSTMRTVIHRNVPASKRLLVRSPQRLDTLRPRREATLDVIAAIPEELRRQARLIEGHLIYGVHRLIPGPSTYLTLLRDPVNLVVSQYRYVLRTPGHRLHDLVTSRDMTLEEYIKRGVSLETDNSQTRAISGDVTTPYGECTDRMLEEAKRNIERRFSVVGLTERFDETLILLRAAFGWRKLCYTPVKVSPDRDRRPEVPAATRSVIGEQNRFDLELYAFALDRFDEAVRRTPAFDAAIERFGRRQALYRPWGFVTHTAPRRIREAVGGSRARVLADASAGG